MLPKVDLLSKNVRLPIDHFLLCTLWKPLDFIFGGGVDYIGGHLEGLDLVFDTFLPVISGDGGAFVLVHC